MKTTLKTDIKPEMLSGAKPEMELHMINTIYAALPMRKQTEKTTFLMQRRQVQNYTFILE